MKKIGSRPYPKLLFFCQHSPDYQELVEKLSQQFSIYTTSKKTAFENLVSRLSFEIVLIETPKDIKFMLYLLNLVRKTQVNVKSVILVNGTLTQKTLAQAFQNGIDDFFPNPVNIGLLWERIKSALER